MADLAKQKALDDQYQNLIKAADDLLAAKTYDQALVKYTEAANLKSAEKYPKEKIEEIDKILADMARQKELDNKYQGMIANADSLLAGKSYDKARAEYVNASEMKPQEQHPKDKVTEIDKIFADLADQKAKEEQYKADIGKADKLLAEKTYDRAKETYQAAQTLKPSEEYPKQKIAEIDTLLAGIAKQKALDERYASLVQEADNLLSQKDYAKAKAQYQAASDIKPAEKYPKDKIAQTDLALADIARQKDLDDRYNTSIAKADKLLADKSYDPARLEYTEAGKLKPAEQYPKDKISEIDKTLADIAKQKSLDERYKSILSQADTLFRQKSWERAKSEYVNAGNIKPNEQYPKDKVSEIDALLAEIKAKDEAYRASVTKPISCCLRSPMMKQKLNTGMQDRSNRKRPIPKKRLLRSIKRLRNCWAGKSSLTILFRKAMNSMPVKIITRPKTSTSSH